MTVPPISQSIDSFIQTLNRSIPNSSFQIKADEVGMKLERLFSNFKTFDEWIRRRPEGCFYEQLSASLCMLPPKVASNVISSLYTFIKTAAQFTVHPMTTTLTLAKNFVELSHALEEGSTYIRTGSAILGCSLGRFVVTRSTSTHPIIIALAGASIVFGFTCYLCTEFTSSDQFSSGLVFQIEQFLESFATGMTFGLLISGAQHYFIEQPPVTNLEEATNYANWVCHKNSLPIPDKVTFHTTHIRLFWDEHTSLHGTMIKQGSAYIPVEPHALTGRVHYVQSHYSNHFIENISLKQDPRFSNLWNQTMSNSFTAKTALEKNQAPDTLSKKKGT